MRILFLSGASRYLTHKINPLRDPSFVYRLHNPAMSALSLGHKIGIYHLRDLLNPFVSKDWDIAIIHRPSFTKLFLRSIDILKKRSIPVIGDFDDLVFSPQYALFRPSVRNGLEPLENIQKKTLNHLAAIKYVDGVSVSNAVLKNAFLNLNIDSKICIVNPNSWHYSWSDVNLLKNRNNPNGYNTIKNQILNLGYLSGTRTHDSDLAMIEESIYEIVNDYKKIKVRFVCYGKIKVPKKLAKVAVVKDKIPFKKYHNLFSNINLNLAPLEKTPFNDAKSAIKIIEAGFFGIQTICSPIPDYLDSPITARIIADEPKNWANGIKSGIDLLMDNKNSSAIREQVFDEYHPINNTKRFMSSLESHI